MSSGGDLLTAAVPDPFLAGLAPVHGAGEDNKPTESPMPLSGLDLSTPPAPMETSDTNETGSMTGDEFVNEVDFGPDRTSIAMILVGSYASAVTLALIWMLWQGTGRTGSAAPTIPASSRMAIDSNDGSAFVAELPEIPTERLTAIGRPLRIGDLEITPLEIRTAPVRLVSATSGRHREGGKDALELRLRIRNLSQSEIFAPLEPAFVREPDRGVPESLIVAEDHPILPYRLATQSEWEINGESFAELEPGEERETVVVSEADALAKVTPSMTWRLRLRTAPERTDVIGVSFERHEVASH